MCKQNGLAVSRRQTTTGLSQDGFFRSQIVLEHVQHLVAALHAQDGDSRVQGGMIGPARRKMRWNSKSEDLPRVYAGLIQTCSDTEATSPKLSALVAYRAHVMWLNFTQKERLYMTEHGHTLLRVLPFGAAELKYENGEHVVDESMLMDWFASSEVVTRRNAIVPTYWTGAQK